MSEASRVNKRLLLLLLLLAVLGALFVVGCGKAGGEPGDEESEGAEGTSPAGGSTIGKSAVKVGLEPLGDSGTSGTATFEEVDDQSVEAELEVEGLPEPGETYYAHLHEGGCTNVPESDDHEHSVGVVGLALALVRPDRPLTWTSGPEYAHGGHNHGHEHDDAPSNEDLPGNLEVPISMSSSNVGAASTTAVLRGVTLERLSSGDPKYRLEVHAAGSGNPPPLACADL